MGKGFDKIFDGKKTIPEEVLRRCMIAGGAVALGAKLRDEHNWDGESLMAAPTLVLEGGVVVDSHWCVLGKLQDMSLTATAVWAGADKDMRVVVRMTDMAMFSFSDTNLSSWLDRSQLKHLYHILHEVHVDRSELDVTFLYPGESGDLESIPFNEACAKGAGEFCIRALICPTSHTGGSIWIAAHPSTKAEMKTRMGENFNTHATPHITIKVMMTS